MLSSIGSLKTIGAEVLIYMHDLKPVLSNAYVSLLSPQVYERVINWSIKEKKTRISITELQSQLEVPLFEGTL